MNHNYYSKLFKGLFLYIKDISEANINVSQKKLVFLKNNNFVLHMIFTLFIDKTDDFRTK